MFNNKNDKMQVLLNKAADELYEELSKGISDKLIKFLEFSGKFHRYSWFNQLLIMFQKPDVSKVAGMHQWNNMGFKVKAGSKAISILAPIFNTYVELEDGSKLYWRDMSEQQRKFYVNDFKKELTGFKTVYVFDKADTEKVKSDVIDDIFNPLGNSHEDAYKTLIKVIQADEIEIIETDETHGAQGYSAGGKIAIKKSADINNKFLTAIHEYAHELLHQKKDGKINRETGEVQAEAISYIVSYWAGLKNPFSSDYILHWGKDKDAFKTNLAIAIKTSNDIITKLEAAA